MFRSRIRIISGFNSEAGSGWRKAKMAHKWRKKYKNVILQGLNVGRGCKFEVLNRSLIFNCPLILIFGAKTWSGSWNRFRIIPGHRSPDHFDADFRSASRFKAGSGPESSEHRIRIRDTATEAHYVVGGSQWSHRGSAWSHKGSKAVHADHGTVEA